MSKKSFPVKSELKNTTEEEKRLQAGKREKDNFRGKERKEYIQHTHSHTEETRDKFGDTCMPARMVASKETQKERLLTQTGPNSVPIVRKTNLSKTYHDPWSVTKVTYCCT